MKQINIKVKTKDSKNIPTYASKEAAGADVRAAVENEIILPPHQSFLVPTGIFVEIPVGYEIQVRPRSGLALKHQITVLNSPGTIDSDYRGEVKVILINHGKKDFLITPNMRIAQLVIAPILQGIFVQDEELALSERGEKGFGHSGVI